MTTSSQVNNSSQLKFAFFSMALAVVFGALAAHALKTYLPPEKIASFQTAVRYQMIHSLAIVLMVLLQKNGYFISKWNVPLFKWGMFFFSGSIYLLSTIPLHGLDWVKYLGPITPLGGILFIAGWLLAARSVVKN